MKPTTIALISSAILATFGIGYLVYFDQKRRTDPNFKKQLKRERKKASKAVKVSQEKELVTVEALVKNVMEIISKENFPETAEAKEAYFMEQVSMGETLCGQGEAYYEQSVEPFYKALRVYPAPLELIMLYQKTLPEKVFRIVVNIMALEQQQRQAEFYNHFPPPELGVKFQELPVESDKPVRGLTATKDFTVDDVLYTETPFIAALHPQLETTHCNYCMRVLDEENKVECSNCDQVAFCSTQCEQAGSQNYHVFMCTNNKLEPSTVATEFSNYTKATNLKYPQMIAQFLSIMVADEAKKNKDSEKASTYTAWDHIERFNAGKELVPTEESAHEIKLIKALLASKVPGIDEFLSDDIYLLLKSKLNKNSYEVPTNEDILIEKSNEPTRVLYTEKQGLGSAIYKISSYIVPSELEEANVSISYDKTNVITVTAIKDIQSGQQIKAFYQ
ncbi:MAS20 protein import receptor-domain-containing protein [Mucor mucedo]|uniref:MAS20 protein import receptor-domain-containing protein n=1 Tax=Mucor mucedo TaxID=29922 RepID=UPI00221FD07A|nr:MAS20 protein import receptor-domain-containing protein [Mucor mucedo]KAI7889235.1 MAS20 protein import receptor-domain-containing protein [Mucor mucedo]